MNSRSLTVGFLSLARLESRLLLSVVTRFGGGLG